MEKRGHSRAMVERRKWWEQNGGWTIWCMGTADRKMKGVPEGGPAEFYTGDGKVENDQ